MFEDLYPEAAQAALDAKVARPPEPKPTPRFSLWGTTSAVPKGVAAGAAQGIGSTADVLGAFGSVLAATGGSAGGMFSLPTPAEDKQAREASQKLLESGPDYMSEAGRSFRNVAKDYTPDPLTTHAAERVVFDFSRVASKAITAAVALGPVPGAVVAGAEEGFTVSDQLAQDGVDLATRSKVGAVTAVTNAVSFALPVAGKTVKQTVGLALAGGPLSFIAQNAVSRKILQDADYSKLADQYDPFDPLGLAMSTVLPLGFGAMAMRGASKRAATQSKQAQAAPETVAVETVDAARTSLLRENIDAANPLPNDLTMAQPHADAHARALDQMAAGERVNVADILPEASSRAATERMAGNMPRASSIPRAENLSGPEKLIEVNLADKVANNFDDALKEYADRPDSAEGKILNTDIARELSPEYLRNRNLSAAVHEPASWFVKQMYERKLAELTPGQGVLFTSGGTGAGKTTAINSIKTLRPMVVAAGIVYDTNMNTLQSAVQKIEQALEAGADVRIIHVQRDPVDALTQGALPRAMRQAKEFGSGRTVPLVEHAKTHRGAAEVIQAVAEKYRGDPRVAVYIVDNTQGKNGARLSDVDFVKRFDYNEVEGRLYEALKQEREAGRISDDVFRATEGTSQTGVRPPVRGDGGQGAQRVNEPQGQPAAADGLTPGQPASEPAARGVESQSLENQTAESQSQVGAEPTKNKVGTLPVVEAKVADLKLSDDVPQFKSGANDKGVVEPLGGKFDRTGVAPIQVWERLDGRLEVISGRHRLDLARRSGEDTIPAQIHREADGFNAVRAASLDAELNIRDGQGKVKDYVQYFEGNQFTREQADSRGLLARATGQRAYTIATDGGADLIAAHRSGGLGDEAAVAIARTAPNDPRLQAVGLKAVQDGKTISTATNTMQAVRSIARERADTTGDMFGFDDGAMRDAEAMAAVVSRMQRELSETLAAVQGASKRPEVAKRNGVNIKDPEGLQKRIVELQTQKNALDQWSTNPDLVAQIRGKMGFEPASQVDAPVAALEGASPIPDKPQDSAGQGGMFDEAPAADFYQREVSRLAAETPDMPVLLEGMDAPAPLSEVMAKIQNELDDDLAASKLLQVAAECAIGAGA